jgi:hypothetical protein
MKILRIIVANIIASCWALTAGASAQVVPTTEAKALDGSTVTFPRPHSGKALLLIIGFSHNSSKNFDQWNQRLKPLYLDNPRVEYYELVDFEDVPSFVMRMILHGMRRRVPKAEHSHFIPFYSGETEWRQLVGYSAPKDAYLLVAEASGHVLWQAHGLVTGAKIAELSDVMVKLTAKVTNQ